METIKLYVFAGVLVTDSERDEYPTESGATLILNKSDAAAAAKSNKPFGYKLSRRARRLCKDFAK